MRPFAAIALLAATLCCAHAQEATLLHSCEFLDGVSIGYSRQAEGTKLFVSFAADHVTEGAGAIGAVSLAPDAPGNTYLSIYLPIEPIDFTDRALVFDAASSTPDRSRALYVRAYDERGNIVMSWQSWDGRLATEAQQFTLVPGEDSSGLKWEPQRIESEDRSAVVRLEFITGTGEDNVYFNLTVDNVRARTY